jgi:hypothetical protein
VLSWQQSRVSSIYKLIQQMVSKIDADDYSGFTQVLQETFEIVVLAGHERFLPNPFHSTVILPCDVT